MSDLLRDIIARNKAVERIAIPSVCSSHPEVLSASLQLASSLNRPLLIEATSDQVNQFEDNTGMDARAFLSFIDDLKSKYGIPPYIVEPGDDHLGLHVLKSQTANGAMAKAQDLVSDYVRAGFKKIHLDCSEGCAGEPPLVDDVTAAEQAALLASSCLIALPAPKELIFMIGTEVPRPGSARLGEDGHIIPTSPESAVKTITAHRTAFAEKRIADGWSQVSGLVVQPNVEFGPDQIFSMPKGKNSSIRDAISEYPGLCLEANSTDYQPPEIFAKLDNMSFAFQNVGAVLTFELRGALYALDHIVQKLTPSAEALPQVMEAAMRENPKHRRSHYAEEDISKWHFNYADRIRYYWPLPAVPEAVDNLILTFDNLKIYEHILVESFSLDILERSKGLAASRGRAIARGEFQGALLPSFLGDRGD